MESNIEWTNKTWNPTTGCTKISAECKYCYAEKETNRLIHNTSSKKYNQGFKNVVMHPETLKDPYNWKQPSTIFVNSMSDLFHEEIPLDFIKEVFKVMNETPWHTYQILTKREELLEQYSDELNWTNNIWMGVSVGEQQAVKRMQSLIKCGAKHKFLSIEPLIEELGDLNFDGIDWVIVGGESGYNKVRPLKKEWVLKIQKQCVDQNVPFFFKQWGKIRNNPNTSDPTMNKMHRYYAKGGCELDGKICRENPTMENDSIASINIFGEEHLIMDEIDDLYTIWGLKTYLSSAEENLYENLKEDIKKNGLNDPILYTITQCGKKLVVDGHTRLKALIALKTKHIYAKELEQTFNCIDEIKLWMTKNQLGRRNLSNLERVKFAFLSKPIIEKLAKANLSIGGKSSSNKKHTDTNAKKIVPVDTYAEIAKIANVSRTTVVQYSRILTCGSETIKNQLNKGDITIGNALKLLKITNEEIIENASEKFTSILPVKNASLVVTDNSINNPISIKSNHDDSLINKNEIVEENIIAEIFSKEIKPIQNNIIILQNFPEGEQKLLNNEIDVVMGFNQNDNFGFLKNNPDCRIGVYYLLK